MNIKYGCREKCSKTLRRKCTVHEAINFLISWHMIPKELVWKGYIGFRHKPDLTAPGLVSCSGWIFKRAKVGNFCFISPATRNFMSSEPIQCSYRRVSVIGTELISFRVYSDFGWLYTCFAGPISSIFPRFMTIIRSLMYWITERSCEINMLVKPNSCFKSFSRFKTCAWTLTSSADTDSSQTMK